MTLDPTLRASWRGFLDLLRPPPGYAVAAAFGTTFGLSIDAFVAALYSHLDCEGDTDTLDPLTGLLAATRLSDRVRVMLHAGNISGEVKGLPKHLATLLDRMILPVTPAAGLFHPKLFVVQFKPIDDGLPERVRLVVGSRNLASSTAFEMGAVMEGVVGRRGSQVGNDAANALRECLRLRKPHCTHVSDLPSVLEATHFEVPAEGTDLTRLHFQSGSRSLQKLLPSVIGRALVLSPFLSREFVELLLARATTVHIVSTPDAYRRLDDACFQALVQRSVAQKAPAMLVLTDDFEDEEGYMDGLHAKVVLVEHREDAVETTWIGSANATGAGWGLGAGNTEAMLELRPGLSLPRFLKAFVFEKPRKRRPWIDEFLQEHRKPLTAEEKLVDELTWLARSLAASTFRITYDRASATMAVASTGQSSSNGSQIDGLVVEFVPLGVLATTADWRPLRDLAAGAVEFAPVELSVVSAFVIVRVSNGVLSVERMAVAELELSEELLAQRDEQARDHLAATVSSEDIIAALVLGITHSRANGVERARRGIQRGTLGQSLLEGISIERLLLAVAQRPEVLKEIEMLLSGRSDGVFTRFRQDIQAALNVTTPGKQ